MISRLPISCLGTYLLSCRGAALSFVSSKGANKYSLQSKMSQPEATAPDQAASNVSAAAHAYQSIQHQQSSTPTSAASPAADIAKDIVMSDRTPDRPAVSRYPARLIILPAEKALVSRNGSRCDECAQSCPRKNRHAVSYKWQRRDLESHLATP